MNALLDSRFGLDADIVRRVFNHDDGQSPRPIKPPGEEDALGASQEAHTVDKHVLGGGGTINTLEDLAMRALGHTRTGQFTPVAGAFDNLNAAQQGIQAALTAYVATFANWETLRTALTTNIFQRDWTQAVATIFGQRMRNPTDAAVAVDVLPPYTTPGGSGTRPLYGEDFFAAARAAGRLRPRVPGGPEFLFSADDVEIGPFATIVPGPPLVNRAVNLASVRLRLVGANVDGGFFVHTAWPQ